MKVDKRREIEINEIVIRLCAEYLHGEEVLKERSKGFE